LHAQIYALVAVSTAFPMVMVITFCTLHAPFSI